MRFANPPGIANFLAEQADYGSLGNQGLKDETENELAEMNAEKQGMETGLRMLAKDQAADHYRDARQYAAGQQRQSAMVGGALDAAAGLASAGIQAGASSGIGTGADFGEVGTSGSDMADFGYTPEQDRLFNSGVGIEWSS
tara:strand:- start:469 stop:891 length:423 start_codon:yes stop_codon:yes gene_type:complete